MKKVTLVLLVTGLMLFLFGMHTSSVYASDQTMTVKVNVKADFWTSKVTFPNGNKATITGIGVVLLDKGLPKIFKTLTSEQSEVTLTVTGAEGTEYQMNMPFLVGQGASVYQVAEKIKNSGQTLTYNIGFDTIYPLAIETAKQ